MHGEVSEICFKMACLVIKRNEKARVIKDNIEGKSKRRNNGAHLWTGQVPGVKEVEEGVTDGEGMDSKQ